MYAAKAFSRILNTALVAADIVLVVLKHDFHVNTWRFIF